MMKTLTLALALLLFGLGFQKARAQDLSSWVSVTPPDEQFAVMMPQPPTVKTQKSTYGQMEVDGQVFTATDGTATYTLWSLTNRAYRGLQDASVEDYLDDCAELLWESLLKPRRDKLEQERTNSSISYQRELKALGSPGREYFMRLGVKRGVARFFVDEEKLYVLTVYNADAANAGAMRFLSSFRPDREKASAAATQTDADSGNGQLRLEVGPGRGSNYPTGNVASTAADDPSDYNRVFTPKETTVKARIVSRPEPQYTESARKFYVTGTVVLDAVLTKTGEVTDVRVIKGLPHGLTRTSIEAVKRMRFIPAMKDGIQVSQRITVEYNYNLY